MAVDAGEARTGLAASDEDERLALPVATVHERDRERLVAAVASEARSRGAGLVVVGYPLNMDGSEGFKAKECAELAREIEAAAGVPVTLWDERCTTLLASREMRAAGTRGRKRRDNVDSLAATLILESFLQARKNRSGPE